MIFVLYPLEVGQLLFENSKKLIIFRPEIFSNILSTYFANDQWMKLITKYYTKHYNILKGKRIFEYGNDTIFIWWTSWKYHLILNKNKDIGFDLHVI